MKEVKKGRKLRTRSFRPRHVVIVAHDITRPIFVLGAVVAIVSVFWLGYLSANWNWGGGGAAQVQASSAPSALKPEIPAAPVAGVEAESALQRLRREIREKNK